MSSMNIPFLTIAEAVQNTGRSPSTVRRLIHTITQDDRHPDRSAIEPDTKQVISFKKKGENFTWRIREDVLLKNFKGALKEAKKEKPEHKADILDILQRELELKNGQIEKQWEVIHALNDRLREGNILMGSLQKRLSLPHPESSTDAVVEASPVGASAEGAKKGSNKKGKKGLFGWMRR